MGKKSDREEMENLFMRTNKLLTDELDKLMVGYKITHPDFYNDYFNARKTMSYGIRHEKDNDAGNGDTPDAEV